MIDCMHIPLSETLRPTSFSDISGQEHLVGEKGIITRIIQNKKPLSLLFFGPPGSGKTTLARMYAKAFDLPFIAMSAVLNSSTELKKIIKENQSTPLFTRQTIVFVDEIHRFNKAQQDIFLPLLEDGTIVLIGATTENPSFSLNNALLSRLRVLTLNPLSPEFLSQILSRYESRFSPLPLTLEARHFLLTQSGGDARHLLNMIENIEQVKSSELLSIDALSSIIQKRPALYDRDQEGHYNTISALHKSIRGSDPDAALYWFARMVAGGEDPLFVARRLIRIASEDIGLADPQALVQAIHARSAYELLGSPEGELALAQAVLYLSLAPKSNATYVAYSEAMKLANETGHLSPPKHILNAPTTLMKNLEYGKGYVYDPDTPLGFSGQNYFPVEVGRKKIYHPIERGFEREMKKRIEYFSKLRKKNQPDDS